MLNRPSPGSFNPTVQAGKTAVHGEGFNPALTITFRDGALQAANPIEVLQAPLHYTVYM